MDVIARHAHSYRDVHNMRHAFPDMDTVRPKMVERLAGLLTYLAMRPDLAIVVGNVDRPEPKLPTSSEEVEPAAPFSGCLNWVDELEKPVKMEGRPKVDKPPRWTIKPDSTFFLYSTCSDSYLVSDRDSPGVVKPGHYPYMDRVDVLKYFTTVALRGQLDLWLGPGSETPFLQPAFLYRPPDYELVGLETILT